MNTKQIWQAALGDLQLRVQREAFDTWIKPATLVALEDDRAVIRAPNIFVRQELEDHYADKIQNTLHTILGYPVQLHMIVGNGDGMQPPADEVPSNGTGRNGQTPSAARSTNGRAAASAQPAPAQQLDLLSPRPAMLNGRYTFGSYIVGSSNRLAHAACLAVAEHPAQAYNPLFLYGGVGLGKTHLLHGIGNHALDAKPDINVLYVSSETFTNDLINAIRNQKTEEFRAYYRSIDILLIDDIQFIAGKEGTQEEFFHTFNTLHNAGKQLVISSDKPPKAIITLEERLRSRFEWGLIVDVQPPDVETRTAILRGKAESINVQVPDEVINFLAHKIQSNIRELEGSLNRVVAYANLNRQPSTVELAQTALSDLLGNGRRSHVTPDAIVEAVAEFYDIDLKIMSGKPRARNIAVPRQVAMYLMRQETEASLMEIGHVLGGRDHTTVLHGCEKIADAINTDPRLRSEVMQIRAKLFDKDTPLRPAR